MPSAPEPKLNALIQDCSLQTAQACFRKLCPSNFKRLNEQLENPNTERFTNFTQFGELPLDGDTLLFAYAESKKDLTERSARKAQFDAAKDLLKARGEYDAGIFIFRGPNGAFRLSFITKIYKGSNAGFSHFRRYTYFVDPSTNGNGTFIRQIGGCSFASLEAIQEAFSVEAINKDFYKELSNWYFWAMKYVHFPTDDVAFDKKDLYSDKEKVREHDAKNLIRLLTRMLFVWFIKQRNLVPHELFDPKAVAEDYLDGFSADYLDGFTSQSNDSRYYKAILQNFFFAALNQERGKREFRKMGATHRDNMCLMRYKDAFKDPKRFVDTVEATTPFLNGGLFECLDFLHPTEKGPSGGAKKCYEDGFSDHKDNPLVVPDFLFFAPEHGGVDLSVTWGITSKKNESVQGLIHILNRYNFTIVENSPIEQEVALDPELLGKVFENLLASYNPETQTTARKQTGSFYTPRPIVDYMVDESLKAYLLKPLTEESCMTEEDAKAGLDLLFSYEEKEMDTVFNESEVNILIHAIDQCKILDPACGSGAFPMGILQKLVFVLGKLDKKNRLWKERQLSKVDQVIQATELIEDSEFSGRIIADAKKQKRDIENSFENNDLGFGRKLYLIENCLYGVDIQSIATQVSKLRFFISLIVDQNIDLEHADGNFGVRPLPNLETKFVAADTLIAVDKPGAQAELTELTDVKKLQNELQDIRHKIFSVKTTNSKQKYKEADKAKREEIAAALKANGWPDETANRLAKWDPYKQNDSADFFDPEWMFGLKGFDLVIGNPPYIQIRDIPTSSRRHFEDNYKFATGRFNLFYLFIEISEIICGKKGFTTFIVPDRLLLNTQCKDIRKWLLEKQTISEIVSFDDQVFDSAVVDSILIMFKNEKMSRNQVTAKVKVSPESISINKNKVIPLTYFQLSPSAQFDLNYTTEKHSLITKVAAASIRLEEISDTKDGIIQSKIGDELFLRRKTNIACEKLLIGKDVNQFVISYKNRWVDYRPDEMALLEKAKGGNGLRLRNKSVFERAKILTRQTSDRIIAAYDFGNFYYANTLHGTAIINPAYNPLFVLAVLNSKLTTWFYRSNTDEKGKVFAQIKIELLRKLPIPKIPRLKQEPLVNLVEEIMKAKAINPTTDTSSIENKIDQKVYDFYNLTYKEIAFVEEITN